jgi:ABC-type multidrug transport system permease subunit
VKNYQFTRGERRRAEGYLKIGFLLVLMQIVLSRFSFIAGFIVFAVLLVWCTIAMVWALYLLKNRKDEQ